MQTSPTITPPPSTAIGVNMIPYGKHHIDEADIKAVVDVLRGKPLTQGPAIDAFEKAIANYVGARYAVAVASGTAGLAGRVCPLKAGIATRIWLQSDQI